MRLTRQWYFALLLTVTLCACGSGSGLDAVSASAHGPPAAAITPPPHASAPLGMTIDLPSGESAAGEATSILVLVLPAHAVLVTGQKTALTALTDDRFGVTWSVSPSVRAVGSSNSFNDEPVIFTAPQSPGIYTVTAASRTNPSQSSSVSIVVTGRRTSSSLAAGVSARASELLIHHERIDVAGRGMPEGGG